MRKQFNSHEFQDCLAKVKTSFEDSGLDANFTISLSSKFDEVLNVLLPDHRDNELIHIAEYNKDTKNILIDSFD